VRWGDSFCCVLCRFCLALACLSEIAESDAAECRMSMGVSTFMVKTVASLKASASIFGIGLPVMNHSGRKSSVGGRVPPKTSSAQHIILLRRQWLVLSPCGKKGSRPQVTTPKGHG